MHLLRVQGSFNRMNLYILRHASAGTRRANPVIDVKRPLDREGKLQCFVIGSYLSTLKIQFDLVVSSPLKRALQTATLVGTEVAYDAGVKVSDGLAPDATLASFLDLVHELQGHENVLLVGHNPNLPQFLASLILNGAATPGRGAIRLRKGAVARVDLTRRPGMLHWLVDPRILRGVYGKAPKPAGKVVKKSIKSDRKKTKRKS
jgi:phosphohistidine phosphatase